MKRAVHATLAHLRDRVAIAIAGGRNVGKHPLAGRLQLVFRFLQLNIKDLLSCINGRDGIAFWILSGHPGADASSAWGRNRGRAQC
jgi:hypothetical protein